MTGRTITVAAAGAVGLAVLALAAGPLLPERPTPAPADVIHRGPPAGLDRVAVRAARGAVRCPPDQPRVTATAACGHLSVTRRQLTCTSPSRCRVDLLGSLASPTRTTPLVLTVTVLRTRTGWNPTEVSS